jgi:hypothetical protein
MALAKPFCTYKNPVVIKPEQIIFIKPIQLQLYLKTSKREPGPSHCQPNQHWSTQTNEWCHWSSFALVNSMATVKFKNLDRALNDVLLTMCSIMPNMKNIMLASINDLTSTKTN